LFDWKRANKQLQGKKNEKLENLWNQADGGLYRWLWSWVKVSGYLKCLSVTDFVYC